MMHQKGEYAGRAFFRVNAGDLRVAVERGEVSDSESGYDVSAYRFELFDGYSGDERVPQGHDFVVHDNSVKERRHTMADLCLRVQEDYCKKKGEPR